MRGIRWAGLVALAAAMPSWMAAQNLGVMAAQPEKYEQPSCEGFRGGHFKVKSGATYVQSALTSHENRGRILNDAKRVLTEAVTVDHQERSAPAWYWLGRVYLYQGDVAGADSSLDRAEQLAPACEADLESIRYNTYVALLRPATQYMQAGQNDSALVLLHQAADFYSGAPHAFRFLGILYYNQRQLDSAAFYFERAIAAVEMPRDSTLRNETMFNLAAAYQNLGRYQEAVQSWRKYLSWVPNDNDAKKALASAFRALNLADSARVIESQLLASSGADGGLTADELINLGVNAFQDGKYEEAATAFHTALATNPFHHRALFNLTNTYVRLENADSIVAVAQRLVAVDPMNENGLRLLARGYQILKNNDQTLKYIYALQALPVNVEVPSFTASTEGAEFTVTATGRDARDQSDRPIAPVAVTLVFELLDNTGNVVGTAQEVAVPTLAVGAVMAETKLRASGTGIVAWRYRRK